MQVLGPSKPRLCPFKAFKALSCSPFLPGLSKKVSSEHTSKRLRGRCTRGSRCRIRSVQSKDDADSQLLPETKKWPASPVFLFATIAGFVAVLYDIFGTGGTKWLLYNVDNPTHTWVVTHIPKFIRDLVFEVGISNISITLGCVGWAICTSLVIGDALDERKDMKKAAGKAGGVKLDRLGPKNIVRLCAAWAVYWTAGGFRFPGDNLLVHFFKTQFNRIRPSTLRYKSFSFPSGHSASATFIVGMVLFAFLPWMLEIVDRRLKEKNTEARLGIMQSPALQKLARSALNNGLFLWPFSVIATASGRVLGDVHWVSDTLAGACLGASVVSLFLIISLVLEKQTSRQSTS